ncbi:hypothetical protein BDW69DRAFT_175444 [Aspergillus filifer]
MTLKQSSLAIGLLVYYAIAHQMDMVFLAGKPLSRSWLDLRTHSNPSPSDLQDAFHDTNLYYNNI